MKTQKAYIVLIKQKIHWLHLAAAIIVTGAFTSVSLLQYASQVLYSTSNTSQPSIAAFKSLQEAGLDKQSQRNLIAANAGDPKPEPVPAGPAAAAPTPPAGITAPAAKTTQPKPAVAPPATTPAQSAGDIASEAVCPGQSSLGSTVSVLACMTAYARTQNGLATIHSNNSLIASANAKAQDMLNCGYSHTACGRAFNYWYAPSGYTGFCAAENIAQGQTTPGEVFKAWMNSAGHRANILNGSYQHIGTAVTPSAGGNLWVMQLGGC